jgi:hypothetical protein
MNNRETKCRGPVLCRCNIENPKFFVLAEETKRKREYFETGIRPYFLMPVFYFLIKFDVQPGNFRIANRNVQ